MCRGTTWKHGGKTPRNEELSGGFILWLFYNGINTVWGTLKMIGIITALAIITVADGDTFTIDEERIRPGGAILNDH